MFGFQQLLMNSSRSWTDKIRNQNVWNFRYFSVNAKAHIFRSNKVYKYSQFFTILVMLRAWWTFLWAYFNTSQWEIRDSLRIWKQRTHLPGTELSFYLWDFAEFTFCIFELWSRISFTWPHFVLFRDLCSILTIFYIFHIFAILEI